MSAAKFIECTACRELFRECDTEAGFARWGQGETIRLLNNPARWGAEKPQVVLLGFSKGPAQNKAMAAVKAGAMRLEEVPFRGMRTRLRWLVDALELRAKPVDVEQFFEKTEEQIHSGSLVRCSISARTNSGAYSFALKDILAADAPAGGKVGEVIRRCTQLHSRPTGGRQLYVMLGLDKELVRLSKTAFSQLVGAVSQVQKTTYRSANVSWAHVAHPSGRLTDSQYQRWCRDEGREPKLEWAREEVKLRIAA